MREIERENVWKHVFWNQNFTQIFFFSLWIFDEKIHSVFFCSSFTLFISFSFSISISFSFSPFLPITFSAPSPESKLIFNAMIEFFQLWNSFEMEFFFHFLSYFSFLSSLLSILWWNENKRWETWLNFPWLPFEEEKERERKKEIRRKEREREKESLLVIPNLMILKTWKVFEPRFDKNLKEGETENEGRGID